MVALPDSEGMVSDLASHDDGADASDGPPALARIGLRLAGAALVAAAFGLWVLPGHGADPAMMLIKLLISIGGFCAGLVCLNAARRVDRRPEVQIDRAARELRVLTPRGARGRHVRVHRLNDLADLSLRGGVLSAHDRSGQRVVSLDVRCGRDDTELRTALEHAL